MYGSIDADVIIIGGGLAGLNAAFCLFQKESTLDVMVLERNEYVGGRLFSVPLLTGNADSLSYFDLGGGQWVHKEQIHLMHLLNTLGIPVFNIQRKGKIISHYKKTYVIDKNKDIFTFFSEMEALQFSWFIIKIETLCRKIKREAGNISCIYELSQISLKTFIQQTVSSKVVEVVINFIVFANCGVQTSEMSALFYIFFCTSTKGITKQLPTQETQLLGIKGGSQNVCEKICEYIGRENIFTHELVIEIVCGRNYVDVITTESSYRCYNVIISVPPKDILKIGFTPPLSDKFISSIMATSTNIVTTFVITYPRFCQFLPTKGRYGKSNYVHFLSRINLQQEESNLASVAQRVSEIKFPKKAFWKEAGFSGNIYVFDKSNSSGPIDFCTSATCYDVPAIAGQIFAGELTNERNPIYKQDILKQLREYFGEEALFPTDYYEKSWNMSSSPMACWNLGNKDFIGEFKNSKRLYWAGAETSGLWYGHIEGAIQSGTKAALEVLYYLRPSLLTADDMMMLSPTRRSRMSSVDTYYREPIYDAIENWKYYVSISIITILILYRFKKRYFGE